MTNPRYQRFFAELKRRRVFRVMAVYGAPAFVVIEAPPFGAHPPASSPMPGPVQLAYAADA